MHGALEGGKRVLIEGAQGSLLDIGYGTYPFVTSSHTIAGGACTGLGLGPTQIGRVVGVAKAYCTRVGAGPFPSELNDAVGERLRERGAEFGTVTGRPRRCGWFDAVAARYARRLNGLTAAVITKLDVLSGLERVKKLVNPQLLRLQSLRAEYLDRAIAAQEAIVRSCKEAEEAARARQRDAATQRLALEKLKDRRRKAYAAAQEAIEERERDDACHR